MVKKKKLNDPEKEKEKEKKWKNKNEERSRSEQAREKKKEKVVNEGMEVPYLVVPSKKEKETLMNVIKKKR